MLFIFERRREKPSSYQTQKCAKDKPDEWTMADLLVHAGEGDAALRLEQLPATEREYWYYELRLHPQWDPLRSDARFEKMLASSQSKTAR